MDKMLVTPEEAAQTLSIGRSKLYELLRAGALGSVRIGGSRRIPVAALQAYVVELGTKKHPSAA
jgi:excisionase family DNA binding protein